MSRFVSSLEALALAYVAEVERGGEFVVERGLDLAEAILKAAANRGATPSRARPGRT